ncbi:FkbM family methyltransferase [Candidatus Magnetomoraceae bacterium gMMP-15]
MKNTCKLDYKSSEILIYAESDIEKNSRAFSCKKEPDTVKWIESNFKKGDIVFDIGANVGAYSLIMSRVMGGIGIIYAFEPNFLNFYHLNKNIILNNCVDSIIPLNIALSDSKMIERFNYRDLTFGSSLHTFNQPIDFVGNNFTPKISLKILSYNVDQFIKEYKIETVNHIKIDVDGIEAQIINGAVETLKNPECRSLMVEFNDAFSSDLDCIKKLKNWGFKISSKRPNPSAFYESDTIYNYVFIKF